jgi:hypothetical protein
MMAQLYKTSGKLPIFPLSAEQKLRLREREASKQSSQLCRSANSNIRPAQCSLPHFITVLPFFFHWHNCCRRVMSAPGRAMAQAHSRRSLTVEARVRVRVSPRGVSWWIKWHWDRFLQSLSVSSVRIIPPWLTMLIYHLKDEQ